MTAGAGIKARNDVSAEGATTQPTPEERLRRQQFLHGMSHAASTVNVVTTDGVAGRHGVTVSAMVSVSADGPQPTLLVCIHNLSPVAAAVLQNGVFCVNTLGADEEKLADLFAGRSGVHLEERFSVGEWITLKTGSPVLASAVIAFDCRTIEIKAVASHNVLFGAVEAVRLGPAGPALVYHDRLYKKV